MKRCDMPIEKIIEMKEYHDKNPSVSIKEIAAKYGICHRTFYMLLKRNGLECDMRGKGKQHYLTDDDVRFIAQRRENGDLFKEIYYGYKRYRNMFSCYSNLATSYNRAVKRMNCNG